MSAKNKARKSTGPRASSNFPPQSNSSNRTLRQRGSAQVSSSTGQGDSSDSDMPTQQLRNRNQRSTMQSTPGPSGVSLTVAADSDDDEQTTLRLSNGRNQNPRRRIQAPASDSDTTSDSDEAPGRIKLTEEKREPKNKKRIRRKNSSESEEDFQPSPSSSRVSSTSQNVSSSNNQSVSSPNRTTLQPRSLSSLVNKCVYYLLIADQKKGAIKRTDIQKHVFAAPERKFYAEVMKEAGNVLKKTYGMEIVVSEKRKGEYMLINILSHDLGIQEFIDYSPSEYQKRGFIFYLLTIIFMNEQSITDAELTTALQPLGIDLNAKTLHPVFGDVRKYLSVDLVKQNYLERKCVSKEPLQFEFTWGERAYQEVDKKDLLEYACQIMSDTRPEEWILQYNDAMSRTQE